MAGNKHVYQDAMRKGHNLVWDGRQEQAAQEYRRAVAEFPDDAAANVSLGAIYLRLNQLPDALAAYEAVLRKTPQDLLSLAKEAEILALMGRHYEADGVYGTLGEAMGKAGMVEKAVEAFRQAATLMPNYAPARARLAGALGSTGESAAASAEYLAAAGAASQAGQADDAIEYAEQALLNDAGNAQAIELLGTLKSGAVAPAPVAPAQAQAATPAVAPEPAPAPEPAAAVKPPQPAAPVVDEDQRRLDELVARAQQLQTLGQAGAAAAAYEEAIAAGVHRAEVEYNLGQLCYQSGRYDDAIEHLRLTCNLPDYALRSHLTIGRCYKSQGKSAKSLEHFLAACGAAEGAELPAELVDDVVAAYRGASEAYRHLGQPDQEAQSLGALADLLAAKGYRERSFSIRAEMQPTQAAEGAPAGEEGAAGASAPAGEAEMPEWQVVAQKLASFDVLLEEQHYLAAIEECHDVISLAPNYVPVHYKLGTVYTRQGRTEHAVEKYLTLGTLHTVRGETALAIDACRQAASAAPRDTRPRSRLAKMYLQIADTEKAMEELDVLGDLQLQGGNREEAKATIRQIIALGPPDVEGYQQLLEQLEAQH